MSARHAQISPSIKSSSDIENNASLDVIPSQEDIEQIENLIVQGSDGENTSFRSIFTGPGFPRRVLMIFIGQFSNPYCQQYIQTLSKAITYASLLALPISTTMVIVGCGPASLISTFRIETGCEFPIFTDPSGDLFEELGMICTRKLGPRPDYQKHSVVDTIFRSIKEGLAALQSTNTTSDDDKYQVGGEFLFEPLDIDTPVTSLSDIDEDVRVVPTPVGFRRRKTPADGEDKIVTWCYRMRHARDHVELPELSKVLGMNGNGGPGHHRKRWAKALAQKKGVGASWVMDMPQWHMASYLE